MNEEIRHLQPAALWNYFADINAIPRASKKEDRIAQFMKNFGEHLGLETHIDENLNVLIRKPATPGMEDRKSVVLQSHLDMVHQKNSDTQFDFDTQGIDMYLDGDWVKAKGTTLGADNGIGVATIMALLASKDISHPTLEALFTIDEETGMTGAKTLQPGWLHSDLLLNLDTEDDDELTIGCAGGIDVTVSGNYTDNPNDSGLQAYKIQLKGLTGGHSGVDIHLGRANANKLMNRLLYVLSQAHEIQIASIQGGSLRNAIPRESEAIIFTAADVPTFLSQTINDIKNEYHTTDPEMEISVSSVSTELNCATKEFSHQFVQAVYTIPSGIYRMTPGIAGLVQTSNNLSKIVFGAGTYQIQNLTRSSVDSEKIDLAQVIQAAADLLGAHTDFSGDYPGWEPVPDAPIIGIMKDLYASLFNSTAHVNAIHAGLECGIIGAHYPAMQMISFGPNIYGAHSPDERVQISSVQKFWKYLLEILKNIPIAIHA